MVSLSTVRKLHLHQQHFIPRAAQVSYLSPARRRVAVAGPPLDTQHTHNNAQYFSAWRAKYGPGVAKTTWISYSRSEGALCKLSTVIKRRQCAHPAAS